MSDSDPGIRLVVVEGESQYLSPSRDLAVGRETYHKPDVLVWSFFGSVYRDAVSFVVVRRQTVYGI
jgi:hypothetical protein